MSVNRGMSNKGIIGNVEVDFSFSFLETWSGKRKNDIKNSKNNNEPVKKNGNGKPLWFWNSFKINFKIKSK